MDVKPLIFIHPMSESLKKIREIIEKTAEEDKIEIYDVESEAEALQLIPSVGQSVMLVANPKKCAHVLKENRKFIKKLGSKILLLTDKNIPRKTLDKFSKVGLTEYIKEPAPPKTLVYKVRLQLRSIKKEEIKEYEQKSLEGMKKQESQEGEGGIKKSNYKEEAVGGFYKSKFGQKKDGEEDDEKGIKQSKESEKLSKNLEGKISEAKENEEEKNDNKSSNSDHNKIDGHLRGKTLEEKPKETPLEKKRREYEEETDPIKKAKLKLQLMEEGEDEEAPIREKVGIEEEKDEESKEEANNENKIDNLLRGDLSSSEEEKGAMKSKLDQAPKEEKEKKALQLKKAEEKVKEEKEHTSQEAEQLSSNMTGKLGEKKEEEDKPDRERKKLKLQEEKEPELREEKEKEEKEKDPNRTNAKSDELEKYIKGSLDHRKKKEDQPESKLDQLLEKEEEEEKKRRAKLKLEEEEEKESKELEQAETEEAPVRERLKKEDEEEAEEKKKKKKLKLEDVDIDGLLDDGKEQKEEKEKQTRDKLKLDDKEKDERERSNWKEDEKNRLMNESNFVEKTEEKKKKKVNASAEKIKTKYIGKGNKHNEHDWSGLDQDPDENFDDFDEDIEKRELKYAEDEDLGEQTINYKKLKEQFDAFDWSPKKKTEVEISSEEGRGAPPTKTNLTFDDQIEIPDEEAEETQEELEDYTESDEIFEAIPNGLDNAIEVLNLYLDGQKTNDDVIKFVSNKIFEEQGYVVFYGYKKESKEFNEIYNIFKDKSEELSQIIEKPLEIWEQLQSEKMDTWKECRLPTWEDSTFQNETNSFFYPFYEGINNLGFAYINFERQVDEVEAKKIEITLESTRAIYLQEAHGKSSEGQYEGKKSDENKDKEEKKGLFGGFFKKKAS